MNLNCVVYFKNIFVVIYAMEEKHYANPITNKFYSENNVN